MKTGYTEKEYWFLTYLMLLIVSLGLYLTCLYVSLVILKSGGAVILKITTFMYAVASPLICISFFLYRFKCKLSVWILIILGLAIILIAFFVLYCLKIYPFQYIVDVLTYIGISLPFAGFCFFRLHRYYTYKGNHVY